MTDRLALFRERAAVWVPALAFVVLNLAGLAAYRVVYAGRALGLGAQLERAEARLAALEAQRGELDDLVAQARENRRGVAELYQARLATEEERLTKIIAEFKELAQRAGLRPAAISYPQESLEDYGLVKKAIIFGVDGTYQQLRQFINFLELSESFITLEEVSLSEAGRGGRLRIDLRLSMLFAAEGYDPLERRTAVGGARS